MFFSLSVQTEALEIYGTSSFFQAPTFFLHFLFPFFCEIVREEEKRNGEEGEENCDRALTSDPQDQSSSSSRNKIGSCWSIFFPPYFSPPKQAVWIRFQAGLCARPSHWSLFQLFTRNLFHPNKKIFRRSVTRSNFSILCFFPKIKEFFKLIFFEHRKENDTDAWP